jgi:hypothetical protein
VFDETIFPYATPGVSVDTPTLREAITFPSSEIATHDHVHHYDLSYLSTNPPLLGDDVKSVQVPSAPPVATLPSPAVAADVDISSAAAAPAMSPPRYPMVLDTSKTYLLSRTLLLLFLL